MYLLVFSIFNGYCIFNLLKCFRGVGVGGGGGGRAIFTRFQFFSFQLNFGLLLSVIMVILISDKQK